MLIDKEFLSIKELAKLICVHPNTIRRNVKNGKINAFKVGKGIRSIFRIPRTEIHRLSYEHLEKVIKKIINDL